MVFYTPEDLANGTFKQKNKQIISKQHQEPQKHGGTLQETISELSTPQINKRKQIKKLNEIKEPSSVKDQLKVFIDFNFK